MNLIWLTLNSLNFKELIYLTSSIKIMYLKIKIKLNKNKIHFYCFKSKWIKLNTKWFLNSLY